MHIYLSPAGLAHFCCSVLIIYCFCLKFPSEVFLFSSISLNQAHFMKYIARSGAHFSVSLNVLKFIGHDLLIMDLTI